MTNSVYYFSRSMYRLSVFWNGGERLPMSGICCRLTNSVSTMPPTRRARKNIKTTPKRPLTSYNFFFREQRKKILEERSRHPDLCKEEDFFSSLGKTVAMRWKEISDAERGYYEELARADRVRYSNEMDAMVRR